VPTAQHEKLFTPFQRLGDVRAGTGLGLGLAAARGLAETMNATLAATDTPGGGLTMTLTMPAADALALTPDGVKAMAKMSGAAIGWDSYLGPNTIGHVLIVDNAARKRAIEAHNTRAGIAYPSYADGPRHHIYEIWRVGNLSPGP
jgi:hypothetical protein